MKIFVSLGGDSYCVMLDIHGTHLGLPKLLQTRESIYYLTCPSSSTQAAAKPNTRNIVQRNTSFVPE